MNDEAAGGKSVLDRGSCGGGGAAGVFQRGVGIITGPSVSLGLSEFPELREKLPAHQQTGFIRGHVNLVTPFQIDGGIKSG